MPASFTVSSSSENVLPGEVVTGALDRGRPLRAVPAHDTNTQLADDGVGYFVYDLEPAPC